MPKPKYHWSMLSMTMRCGEAARRRYWEGNEKIPPGFAQLIGLGVHKGIDANLRNKVEHGSLLSLDAVVEISISSFRKHMDEDGYMPTEEEKAEGIVNVVNQAERCTRDLAVLHLNRVAPRIQPIHIGDDIGVELPLTIELPELPFDIGLTLDILEQARVRDTKTHSKRPPADAADRDDQLTTYGLAAWIYLRGKGVMPADAPPENITLCLDVLTRTKTPQYYGIDGPSVDSKGNSLPRYTTRRTQKRFESLIARFHALHRAVEKGVFLPTDNRNWYCSPQYCGYWATCRFAER